MCITFYFYFYISYNLLTTQNLFSIHHHTADPLYPFHTPPPTPSPLVTTTLFSVSAC